MEINSINNIPINKIPEIKNQYDNKENENVTFSSFLKKAIYDVSDAKNYEEELTKKFIKGELENIHELSIARNVASLKLQAMNQVITKVNEAYKLISRMQM